MGTEMGMGMGMEMEPLLSLITEHLPVKLGILD